MNTLETIKEKYKQLQLRNGSSSLTPIEQNAYDAFDKLGIPTVRNEEWKYTRISNLFNKEYAFVAGTATSSLTAEDIKEVRLPAHEEANEIVFVNGIYSAELSTIRSTALVVQTLQKASSNEYKEIVLEHLGHSAKYVKDGIHAMNTAFAEQGIFIYVKKGQITEHPIYIYQVTDARSANILSQPRSLIYVSEGAQVQIAENYLTLGVSESFVNQVLEVVVEQDAIIEYYKIQNDKANTNQVNTTHFRQVGKSTVHTVSIILNGGIVRNNLNIALEAEHSEALLHGLYFVNGNTHVDNHTVVDNVKPHCLSNELYKGVVDDSATAVFNGKIYVQQDAQKTNAFQSNKNVLLSDTASVNTKPQLEIFADDVKCSHGCTVGQLDEEALFYLRSRGVNKETARSLLVHAFAIDILEHIKSELIRAYVDEMISQRLEFKIA